jgi:hypothetical protein
VVKGIAKRRIAISSGVFGTSDPTDDLVEDGGGIPPMLGAFGQLREGSDFAVGCGVGLRGSSDGPEILNGNGI